MMRHSHRPVLNPDVNKSQGIEITEFGRREAHTKGLERRNECTQNGLLRENYSPKQSIFASTDTERTYQTALEFFKGLYPFETAHLNQQPFQDVK